MPDYGVLAKQMEAAVGAANVLTGDAEVAAYAVDGVAPKMVVIPGDVAGVQAAVRAAAGVGASVVPWGHGTKMGLGRPRSAIDVVLSLSRLTKIVEYDVENLTIIAQAGVVLQEMQKLFAPNAQFLPMDPAFPGDATLGGVIATNASGPRRLAYGAARDLVLGMKVVMANGDLVSAGGKTVKNVAGYDLDKLFIGSMGTLGIVVEVASRLLPAPEKTSSLVAAFTSLDAASAAAGQLLKSQYLPAALEILNAKSVAAVGAGSAAWALLIPIEGAREAVDRQVIEIAALCRAAGSPAVDTVSGDAEAALWLKVRDLPRLLAVESPGLVAARCSVVISGAQKTAEAAVKAASARGLSLALDIRAGNGVVNAWFLGQAGDETRQAEAASELRAAAAAAGGTMVLDRAPVKVKEAVSVWGQPGTDFVAMKAIKSQLDPQGILNPGRYVGGI